MTTTEFKQQKLKEFHETYVEFTDAGTLVRYWVEGKQDLEEFISQMLDDYSQMLIEEIEKEKHGEPYRKYCQCDGECFGECAKSIDEGLSKAQEVIRGEK